MKKTILSFILIFSSTGLFASTKCAFKCEVSKGEEIVLMELEPIGGYTSEFNTSCIGRVDYKRISVTSQFGTSLHITILGSNNFVVGSVTPENKGFYSLRANDLEVYCVKLE